MLWFAISVCCGTCIRLWIISIHDCIDYRLYPCVLLELGRHFAVGDPSFFFLVDHYWMREYGWVDGWCSPRLCLCPRLILRRILPLLPLLPLLPSHHTSMPALLGISPDDPRSMTSQMNIDTSSWAVDLAARYKECVLLLLLPLLLSLYSLFLSAIYFGQLLFFLFLTSLSLSLSPPPPSLFTSRAEHERACRMALACGAVTSAQSSWTTSKCMQCCCC